MPPKIKPQTKAVVMITPTGTCIVRTDDGRHVALAPQLAVDVARTILDEGKPAISPPPAKSAGWVQ
jgi:hypothetical protein